MTGSIRTRLLLSLLLALAAAAALVGGVSYRNVLLQTETLFDYQLRQMALSLRDQGEIAPQDAAALNDESLDFVIQIWRIDGRSVYSSRDHRALPSRTVLGFADIEVEGQRWRSFGVAARDRVIQVAQPWAIRQGLAADAALRSFGPLAAAAPLMAALLWWLIAQSLRPLERVAGEVRSRDAAALAPLVVDGLPDEVAPLVVALNALLARLSAALDGQRAFVADAAHELRSPLTALRLQAQLVRRAPDDAARNEAVDALIDGVDRAVRGVEQLLALARYEPGAAPPPMAAVPLAPLLRQVLADAAPLAQARGTTIELKVDNDESAVTGDAAALAVLVRNLVDNALRYTPAGGQVRVALAADASGTLLSVDDNGPGIAVAERERVFERFVRGSSAAGQIGSGLGLAIARTIALQHGAALRLLDSPLGGLRVELRFKPVSSS
ncbi:MAG: sensor histidine kinase N-terminal domain-containing protein [Burkholderiales bacterium]|nr:sensor histidine kinase N-terminal domain-containing protein [Burkholderiales bacterium]